VPVQILRCLDTTPVSLFIPYESGNRYVLFREAGYDVSRERAEDVAANCGSHLYIRGEELEDFCRAFSSNVHTLLEDESISPVDRFDVLQIAISVEVENSWRSTGVEEYVDLSHRLGGQITSLMQHDDVLTGDLFGIVRHDYTTFVHVTNVAGYAVLLARGLGIVPDELEVMAVGALLHDLGKRLIPSSILSKPARLDPSEREIICTHPQRGYEELCGRSDVEKRQLMMVYQHHEHLDGNGYPVRVLDREIDPWAKLLAVVDVFDALTGVRPYRRPATKGEALNFLRSRAGSQFDAEMVACWTSLMQEKK
jgi:HD-GYP domain-containing protein (c-di-GMP phosphodiesterase class II)